MKRWRLLFRVRQDANASLMPSPLRRDIDMAFRVEQSYAVDFMGARLVGFDILVKDQEFNHVVRIIKMLEKRHRLIMHDLSELQEGDTSPSVSIKIGAGPTQQVA